MAKKESLKKDKKEDNFSQPKKSNALFHGKAFGVVKFILGICLLPYVYSCSVAFLGGLVGLDKVIQNNFWYGLITLLAIYLFIWEPAVIYAKGQKILEFFFSFLQSMVKVAPYLIPIYAIVLFLIYLPLSFVNKSPELVNWFVYLFGFSMGLHLVFGAKSLRTKQEDFLKANYIFGFSFVYILNLVLAAFIFNFIFKEFSLVNFLNSTFQIAGDMFKAVFTQLFVVK